MPKFLLDTNVFRSLAHNQQDRFLTFARTARNAVSKGYFFYVCDFTVAELCRHIDEEQSEKYPIIHRSFVWMDILCSNRGLVPFFPYPLSKVILGTTFSNRSHQIEANKVRRKIVKAQQFTDLDKETLSAIKNFQSKLIDESNEWVERFTSGFQEFRESNKQSPAKKQEVTTEMVIDLLVEHFRMGVYRFNQNVRPHALIKYDLREYWHANSELFFKALNTKPYNFRKHKNDMVDISILAYCGLDYTVVTADKPLIALMKSCSNPRVVYIDDTQQILESL